MEPRVGIVLVNWNGREVTLACLRSLRAVSYGNAFTVVVDNASADGSVEAIRAAHPDVTVLPQRTNLLFAGGSNEGMRHALAQGADLLLLLNNDTEVAPDFLGYLVERLQHEPGAGAVAPKILYHARPDTLWFAGGEISFWSGTMRHTGIRERDDGRHDRPHDIDYATGCAVLVTRGAVERVGMLDTGYRMYTEDADWSLRIRRAGFRVLYEPRSRVWHKVSVSTGGNLSAYKLKHKFLGNLRFFARHARWYHWLVFPWANVLVNGAAALRYLLSTRGR